MTKTLNPLANVQTTTDFFEAWCPKPQPKNLTTQVGCHFEEFAEMLNVITVDDQATAMALAFVQQSIQNMADHLKKSTANIVIKDRVELLDGLCDQMVTATGIAHMAGMNMPAAFGEVNRSNNSKFDADGKPILDANMKLQKGPFYTKPDLKSFV